MLNRYIIKDDSGVDQLMDQRLPGLKTLEDQIEKFFRKVFLK